MSYSWNDMVRRGSSSRDSRLPNAEGESPPSSLQTTLRNVNSPHTSDNVEEEISSESPEKEGRIRPRSSSDYLHHSNSLPTTGNRWNKLSGVVFQDAAQTVPPGGLSKETLQQTLTHTDSIGIGGIGGNPKAIAGKWIRQNTEKERRRRFGHSGSRLGQIARAALSASRREREEELNRYESIAEDVTAEKNVSPRKWYDIRRDHIGLMRVLTSSYINLLILIVPVAILGGILKWQPSVVFWLNFVAIMPLAWILGQGTEDLALWTGTVVGGLINATLGNIVELIIAISALRKDLIVVIQASLLGFLFGGFRHKEQKFSAKTVSIFGPILFLASMGVILPTVFSEVSTVSPSIAQIQSVSNATAIILALLYVLYLFYELRGNQGFDDEEEEVPVMTPITSVILLTAVTVLVAVCSEFLVDSIGYVSKSWGLSEDFIGIILLPIVGNAAEHLTAVIVAVKNKMDLSIAVALGSSIQIALFAVSFMVLVGWAMDVGPQPMTLDFSPRNAITFFLGVIIVFFVIANAESNWLKGTMLLGAYSIIAVGYAFVP